MGEYIPLAAAFVVGHEVFPVPEMQRIACRFGGDQRAVVGPVFVDRAQVERDERRDRRRDAQGDTFEPGMHPAMQMAAMDCQNGILEAVDRIAEIDDPLFGRGGIHPVDPAYDRRVVHEDDARARAAFLQFVTQPVAPTFAEGTAVATGFEGVEADDPQPVALHHIVQELVFARCLGEGAEQFLAIVMVADQRQDRTGDVR